MKKSDGNDDKMSMIWQRWYNNDIDMIVLTMLIMVSIHCSDQMVLLYWDLPISGFAYNDHAITALRCDGGRIEKFWQGDEVEEEGEEEERMCDNNRIFSSIW